MCHLWCGWLQSDVPPVTQLPVVQQPLLRLSVGLERALELVCLDVQVSVPLLWQGCCTHRSLLCHMNTADRPCTSHAGHIHGKCHWSAAVREELLTCWVQVHGCKMDMTLRPRTSIDIAVALGFNQLPAPRQGVAVDVERPRLSGSSCFIGARVYKLV